MTSYYIGWAIGTAVVIAAVAVSAIWSWYEDHR